MELNQSNARNELILFTEIWLVFSAELDWAYVMYVRKQKCELARFDFRAQWAPLGFLDLHTSAVESSPTEKLSRI